MNERPLAAIFDLDGTLLDTLDDIAAAANTVLAARYGVTFPVAAYRRFVGSGVAMLFTRALTARHPATGNAARPEPSEEDIAACVAGFEATYRETWDQTTRPYGGVSELLAALEANGVALAILSNKPHAFTRDCAARYFPQVAWTAVIGQRPGIPVKPDPTSLREIVAALPGPAIRGGRQVAYIGDSDVDMLTGRAGGVLTVGVTWGFRTADELTAAGADFLVETPQQLGRRFGLA